MGFWDWLTTKRDSKLDLWHKLAYSNFTWRDESKKKEQFLYHDIYRPFTGDCDDFAASVVMMYGQGAEYVTIELPREFDANGKPLTHAVCRVGKWISDNRYPKPYKDGALNIVRVKDYVYVKKMAKKG